MQHSQWLLLQNQTEEQAELEDEEDVFWTRPAIVLARGSSKQLERPSKSSKKVKHQKVKQPVHGSGRSSSGAEPAGAEAAGGEGERPAASGKRKMREPPRSNGVPPVKSTKRVGR